jgi:hypothetical protein
VSAGKISLPDLERVSIDDVQELLIYLEWENKEHARREVIERQKSEAEAKRVPKMGGR